MPRVSSRVHAACPPCHPDSPAPAIDRKSDTPGRCAGAGPAITSTVVLTALLTSALLAATPAAGEVAPDFSVKDVDGNALQLSQLVEERTVLLVFFPRAFTPG